MLRIFLVIDDYNELIYIQTLLKKMGFDVEGLQNTKKYTDVSLGFNPHILVTTARGNTVNGIQLASSIRKIRGMPKIIALKSVEQKFSKDEKEGIETFIDTPINPKKLLSTIAELGDLDESVLLEKYAKIKGLIQPNNLTENVIHQAVDENGQPIQDIKNVKSAISDLLQPNNESKHKFNIAEDKKLEENIDANGKAMANDEQKKKFPLSLKSPSPLNTQTEEQLASRLQRFDKWKKEMGEYPHKKFNREQVRELKKTMRSATQPDDIDEIEDQRRKYVDALFKK